MQVEQENRVLVPKKSLPSQKKQDPEQQHQQQHQQQQQPRRRLHNLYVKNLPEFVDDACLVAAFSRHCGAVVSACVLRGVSTRGRCFRGGKGGGKGRKGSLGSGEGSGGDTTITGSSRSPDSSKRCGFVEMATAEGASAAIAALDGKHLALLRGEEGGGAEGARARADRGSCSPLPTLALSPSLALLVSDRPLSFSPSSFSSSSSGAAGAAEGARLEEPGIRVAHALSRESRQQQAWARAEEEAATEAARLRRARAAVDERSRHGRGSVSSSSPPSESPSRLPLRGSGGGGGEAGRW